MSGQANNPYYQNYFGILDGDANKQAGITAAMPGGSLVGALLSSILSDKFGRKKAIIIGACIWIFGCTLQCASQNVAMLVIGRFIAGISVGIASSIVPVYQSEIAPPNIRGRLVSLQQWAITWGILIQYFIQLGSSYISSNASFRLPWGLQIIPAAILAIGMMFFPESPRWLANKNRWEECLKILADVQANGDKDDLLVQLEYNEIKEAIKFDQIIAAKSWSEVFQIGMRKRVFMGVALQAWSQLTGMNVMMYYIVYVFQGAGLKGQHANLIASSIQYVLNVLFTLPAVLYLDKWGRRPTLLVGSFFMALWLFLVGGIQGAYGNPGHVEGSAASVWLITNNISASHAVIAFSFLFVCSFACTWGLASWTYPAEIYPLRLRAKAVSLSTSGNWIFNFALAYAHLIQFHKTYFIFASFNILAFIHVFLQYPETKGRTLEEMDVIFDAAEHRWPWKIPLDYGKRDYDKGVSGKGGRER